MINDIIFFLKKNLILDLFIHNGVKERERERESEDNTSNNSME
jgi:hypothetical protein